MQPKLRRTSELMTPKKVFQRPLEHDSRRFSLRMTEPRPRFATNLISKPKNIAYFSSSFKEKDLYRRNSLTSICNDKSIEERVKQIFDIDPKKSMNLDNISIFSKESNYRNKMAMLVQNFTPEKKIKSTFQYGKHDDYDASVPINRSMQFMANQSPYSKEQVMQIMPNIECCSSSIVSPSKSKNFDQILPSCIPRTNGEGYKLFQEMCDKFSNNGSPQK